MPSSSILTAPTLDPGAIQSSASIAHPWWSGDDLSPAASVNACDLGLVSCRQQSVGAITVNPAYIKSRTLWARVARALPKMPIKAMRRRASSSSWASSSSNTSKKSQAASFAARSCPYSHCNHAVCAAARR